VLDQGSVLPYLRQRGLLTGDATVETLTGGVSCIVLAVSNSQVDLVVKQALPELKTKAKWVADQNRRLEVKYGVKGPEDYVWRYTRARKAAYLRLGLELPEGDLTSERSNRLTTSRLKIV
jgi:hypothetical protein